MIQDTALRFAREGFAAPLLICNQEHRFLIAEQLRESGVTQCTIVLEPTGRNTAPAAAVAALIVAKTDADAIVLLLPSDHLIGNIEAFHEAVGKALAAARAGALVTFGVKPAGPVTGYGYISGGEPLAGAPGCFRVQRFVEKPDRATAERYVSSGNYFWNSGIFQFSAQRLIAEVERLQPPMLAACKDAVGKGLKALDFL